MEKDNGEAWDCITLNGGKILQVPKCTCAFERVDWIRG